MNTTGKFNIGLVQMAVPDDPDASLKKAVEMVERAAGMGANVICLPELFRTSYFCQREDPSLFDLAEPVQGPSVNTLSKSAAKLGVTVIASIFEKRAPGLYHNTAAVINHDGLAGIYRKTHIPDDPGYYEKYYFTPGDLGFAAFDTPFGRIGVLVCWDQWYPEAARLTALKGASVIFYPTAIGWSPAEKERFGEAQKEAWRTIQRGHAIANGVYVAAVNRVGFEQPKGSAGLEFWGGSFVAGPFGALIKEASADHDGVIVAEIDPARIEETRRNWPFLRDRRTDIYGGVTERFLDKP